MDRKSGFQTENDETCRGTRLLAKTLGAGGSGRAHHSAGTAVVVVGHRVDAIAAAIGESEVADAGTVDAAFVGTAHDTAFAAVGGIGFEGVAEIVAGGLSVRTGHFVFAATGKHQQGECKSEGGEHFHSTKSLIRNLPLR